MVCSPYIIAISGGSGSGKSTVTEALIDVLPEGFAALFHEDGYYWPRSHYPDGSDVMDVDYDDPASKDLSALVADLAELKAGRCIQQPIYDYTVHDRFKDRTLRVEPRAIILFEGIHALSISGADPLIDLKVYVDTPDDLRLARRLRRDVLERERPIKSVLDQYLSAVRPAHYRYTYPAKFAADLVIADEGLPAYGTIRPSQSATKRMLAPILDRLQQDGLIKEATHL